MGVVSGRSYRLVHFKRISLVVLMETEYKGKRENIETPSRRLMWDLDGRSGTHSKCPPWEQEAVTRFWMHSECRVSRNLEKINVECERKRTKNVLLCKVRLEFP